MVFNFYPITALMIILLALLNDIPILAIAYDNTKVDRRPVRWNMPEMLTVSSVLGVAGVIASFLLFFLLKEYGFSEDMIRTLLFLKLIIAGHSTIYVTRTEGLVLAAALAVAAAVRGDLRHRDPGHVDRRLWSS